MKDEKGVTQSISFTDSICHPYLVLFPLESLITFLSIFVASPFVLLSAKTTWWSSLRLKISNYNTQETDKLCIVNWQCYRAVQHTVCLDFFGVFCKKWIQWPLSAQEVLRQAMLPKYLPHYSLQYKMRIFCLHNSIVIFKITVIFL